MKTEVRKNFLILIVCMNFSKKVRVHICCIKNNMQCCLMKLLDLIKPNEEYKEKG